MNRICTNYAQIRKGLQELPQNGGSLRGAENRSPAHPAGSCIKVHISRKGGEFLPGGFEIPEVISHVRPGSKQPLFFSAPQSDSDCSSRFCAELLQNADGFHHDGCTGCIVGGPQARVP